MDTEKYSISRDARHPAQVYLGDAYRAVWSVVDLLGMFTGQCGQW